MSAPGRAGGVNRRNHHRHSQTQGGPSRDSFPDRKRSSSRVPEVMDCWFESGSMPYAQAHYPFENKEAFEAGFPADFIAEGLDQTRGWFYTLMVLSTALFDKPAFKNVIVNGMVLAEDGRKMSKRLRNYPDPMELIQEHGADAVRIFMLQSAAVRGEELRFSSAGVKDMVRRVMLPWWNSVSFFCTYAHVDEWDPALADWDAPVRNELDQWIEVKLKRLQVHVEREMGAYELSRVIPPLLEFIDHLTNWYIRRSRRRFWKAEDDTDKNEAYKTLYRVLVSFSELMAPVAPFMAEHVYQLLRRTEETRQISSVHLRILADAEELSAEEREVESRMDLARTLSEMGRELRAASKIRTRQPLGTMRVGSTSEEERAWVEASRQLILDELNIKDLEVIDDPTQLASVNIKPNLPKLGPKLGKQMKVLMGGLRNLDPEVARTLAFGGSATVAGFELGPEDVLVQMEAKDEGFRGRSGQPGGVDQSRIDSGTRAGRVGPRGHQPNPADAKRGGLRRRRANLHPNGDSQPGTPGRMGHASGLDRGGDLVRIRIGSEGLLALRNPASGRAQLDPGSRATNHCRMKDSFSCSRADQECGNSPLALALVLTTGVPVRFASPLPETRAIVQAFSPWLTWKEERDDAWVEVRPEPRELPDALIIPEPWTIGDAMALSLVPVLAGTLPRRIHFRGTTHRSDCVGVSHIAEGLLPMMDRRGRAPTWKWRPGETRDRHFWMFDLPFRSWLQPT